MKPLLLFTGPVVTRSGYGAHSRDLVRSLIKMDKFEIHINSLRWGNTPWNALNLQNEEDKLILDRILKEPNLPREPDIHIQVSIPSEFTPLAKYNIGVTAGMENTAPVPSWVDGMNKMDMVICTSNFTRDTFKKVVYEQIDKNTNQKTGELRVVKPMEVLFEGVDTSIYKQTKEFSKDLVDEMNMIEEKFCFLYVGHWLQGDLGQDRKDTGMLVKTFLEKFKNVKRPPALIMKTSSATFSVIDRRDILKRIEMIKKSVKGNLPPVYLLHGDLEDEEMNQLYNHPKVKVMVSFTKGEGFGRPLLEASIAAKPIIASNWSGHLDFLNKKHSVLLPGNLTKVHKSALPKDYLVENAQWFTVNYQYAAQIMMDMFKNYRKYTFNAKKQAMVNKSKFSLKSMSKVFESILNKYLPKFEQQPQAVDLKLPDLKLVSDNKPLLRAEDMKLPKLKRS